MRTAERAPDGRVIHISYAGPEGRLLIDGPPELLDAFLQLVLRRRAARCLHAAAGPDGEDPADVAPLAP